MVKKDFTFISLFSGNDREVLYETKREHENEHDDEWINQALHRPEG
jgi:hypothetical protein